MLIFGIEQKSGTPAIICLVFDVFVLTSRIAVVDKSFFVQAVPKKRPVFHKTSVSPSGTTSQACRSGVRKFDQRRFRNLLIH